MERSKVNALLVVLILILGTAGAGCISGHAGGTMTAKSMTHATSTSSISKSPTSKSASHRVMPSKSSSSTSHSSSASVISTSVTSTTSSKASSLYPVTITDFAGRKVTIKSPPKRVIVLSTYWAEIMSILGVQNTIVGIGKYIPYDPYVPKSVRSKPVVGSNFEGLNWETVVSLKPDLIIMDWYGGKFADGQTLKKAEQLGIPVIALSARRVQDNIKVVEILGKVFGKEKKAQELADWMKAELNNVTHIASNITDRKNVLMINAPTDMNKPITVYAKGSAWASIIDLVGANNVAYDRKFNTQWPQLDLEKITAYWGNKTDVLIVTSFRKSVLEKAIKEIKSDPRWRGIKAVREGHVYGILAGSNAFLDWGPRIVVAVYQIGDMIYPQYYPDWRIVAKQLLKKFYGMQYSAPVTVMDSMGREVTFEKPPQRVIVLSDYWAEVLYCLGVANRIVGIGKYVPYDQFLPSTITKKPTVGSTWMKGINWETVASLKPDLIIMGLWKGGFTPGEQEVIDKSKELGYKVLAFGIPNSNLTGTTMPYENIRIIRVLGDVFGKEQRAQQMVNFLESYYRRALKIAASIPKDKRKNVLVVYGASIVGKYATGAISISYKGSAYAQTVELVGANNVAFEYNFSTQYPKLDLEKLIAYFGNKTDVLIVVDWDKDRLDKAVKKIETDPTWKAIKAVKEGHVVGILVGSWSKDSVALYGPRFVAGIYAFGHAIYPQYYPDWQPILKEILQRFYGTGG